MFEGLEGSGLDSFQLFVTGVGAGRVRRVPTVMALACGLAGDAEGVGDRWPVEAPAVQEVHLGIDLVLEPCHLLDEVPQSSGCFARGVSVELQVGPWSREHPVLLSEAAPLALTHRCRRPADAARAESARPGNSSPPRSRGPGLQLRAGRSARRGTRSGRCGASARG